MAAGLFALDQSFRRGALKDEFEAACSEFLQHPLTIEKFEGLKLPSFVIVARNVILLDKDQTPMVDCPQVSLEISPRTLLQFKIVIEKIIFSNPTIYFRTAAGKRLNISEMVADIEKSPAPPPRKHFALQFRQFVIENGRLNFHGPPKFELDFKGALRIEFELPVNSSQGLTGGAQLETLTLGEEEFQDVTAQFLYKSDSFKINKIEAKGLGGSLSGSAALTPAHVAIQMSATHIESRNLFRLFHSSLEIRGLCEWDGELTSGYGNDFLSKANGKASFKMENGHLPEVPVLLKTFSAANVLSLVNYLKGQKKEPGIPISRAEGKITIENGIAKSDDPFVIKNDLLQIGFQGQVDLAKQTVKGTVVIHVLTLPDEILGAVPGLKWILMGKNRSFFPIFVGIKGPLQDPKVNTQSLKSLTGPVWQTLNRIFNLPKDIVDKLR